MIMMCRMPDGAFDGNFMTQEKREHEYDLCLLMLFSIVIYFMLCL